MRDDLTQLLQTLSDFSKQAESWGLRPDKAHQLAALARALLATASLPDGAPVQTAQSEPDPAQSSAGADQAPACPEPGELVAETAQMDSDEEFARESSYARMLRLEKTLQEIQRETEVSSRVLLVSDDMESQEEILETLAVQGVMADMEVTCADACDRLQKNDYAVLVADLQLPDFDCSLLTEQCTNSKTGLELIVSGTSDSLDGVLAAMKQGASDFLPRPFPSRPFITWKVRGALARFGFARHSQAVIQFLSRSLEKTAQEKGLDPIQSCAAPLQKALQAYQQLPGPTNLAVLGPKPLVRTAQSLGHNATQVADLASLTEQLKATDTQVVVAVEDDSGVEGVEVITRVRRLSPEIGLFVIAPERKLEDLVKAIDSGIGDYLLRPMEGRELFAPRLDRLIERQNKFQRYNQLVRELKTLNVQLIKQNS